MAEDVFKNIKVLKGIPVDEFMSTMGFFSASLGENCTFCHVEESGGSWARYADDNAQKQTARRMIAMEYGINKAYFGGKRVVTCYSCHRGVERPRVTPSLAELYGPPLLGEADEIEQTAKSPSADQVLDKYVQALGGAERLGKLTSFAAKGTNQAFAETEKNPLELYAKEPNQRMIVVHSPNGDSTTTYDGHTGWTAAPYAERPVPVLALTGGDLDGAQLDAELAFPAHIKQAFATWRVGLPVMIDDRTAVVLQGSNPGHTPVKFYFDKETGLLSRVVRYRDSPVGLSPTQIDYADYREVAGVKVPFRWTVTWLDGKSTVELTDVQPNASIGAEKFAKPVAPAERKP